MRVHLYIYISLLENGKKINLLKENGFYQMERIMKVNSKIINLIKLEHGNLKMETH